MTLERPLKILVTIGLVFLYFQRLILPMMGDFNADRLTLANMKLAVKLEPTDRRLLEEASQKLLSNSINVISGLLPAFDQTRDHLWAKIEKIRAQFPGTWEFRPAPAFLSDGKIVRWLFNLHFEGTFADVVTALAWLECDGQIVRLRNLSVTGQRTGVLAVDAAMELLFLDSAMAGSLPLKESAR